ncbi:MAG: M14 metallopeptidase family protein [Spirosomataceae bacterium]|jgi:hypothetical protein
MRTLLLFSGILISFLSFGQANLDYYLPKDVSYSAEIPTPKQYLGYEVGEQHATPYEVYGYFREVAKHSNRIRIETYARSFENRELILATVSNPENLQNIEIIKKEHQKISDPSQSNQLKLEKMPLVVWMGYSVHGNEASGVNSALLSIYYLAAAQGPKIDELLKNTIILVDPCINPDGGNRFATWVNQNKSKNLASDANNREFKETWPGGRSNHYWFDMNRDWLYQQLPESKGRMIKFYDWLPNILTDHHEMGSNSTFFFQPGIPERTHPLTPLKNIELTSKIGQYHAEGLDSIGSYYYTKENYDDFYYGKGSTLPDANGSIGILFEQASSRGHLQQTSNGLLSFPFTIRNQFSATLSTLKAAQNMRVELMNYMKDFYAEKPTDDIKSYVFGGNGDKVAVFEMLNVLRRNKIEVFALSKTENINGISYNSDNSYVVPANQPRHRLIKSLFERRTSFADSAFYDISSWTLPLCMNVPFAESKIDIAKGKSIDKPVFTPGKVMGKSKYSYVFEWSGYYAPKVANYLVNRGYKLKYATLPFEAMVGNEKKKFTYGAIQVICGGKDISEELNTIAIQNGIDFFGIESGLTVSGINLGSEKFRNVEKINPLMIVGEGVDYNDAGEIWHLLDQRMDIVLNMADLNQINRLDLSKYSHIIINQGRYNELSEDKIKNYLNSGGTVIALGDGAGWISQKKLVAINLKPEASADSKSKKPFDQKSNIEGALVTSGAIVETQIDISHPMGYGYTQKTLPIFKVNNVVFEDTGNPYNTPLVFSPKPLISGYIHQKNQERIKNAPAVIVQNVGGGKVVCISDNPNFRAFWYGTNKLFLNALFFNNGMAGGRFEED